MSGASPHEVPLPERGAQCPPAVALEALSAGEAPPEGLAAHVAGCAACGTYVAALQEAGAAFRRARPPELFLRQLAARRARPRGGLLRHLAWALPAAAALALPLLLLRPAPSEGIREKGGGAPFKVLRKAPGQEQPDALASDGRVRAGDALRFAYEAPADGWLLVLDLDGTGTASVFHPFGGERAAPVKRGTSLLERAVVLDGAPGPEWLAAVFSEERQEAAGLLAQLRGQAGAAEVRLSCGGCRVTMLRLQKVP